MDKASAQRLTLQGAGAPAIDLKTGELAAAGSTLSDLFLWARFTHERLLGQGWLVTSSTVAMVVLMLLGIFMGLPRLRNTLSGWHKSTAWFTLPLILLSPLTGLCIAFGVTFQSGTAPAAGGIGRSPRKASLHTRRNCGNLRLMTRRTGSADLPLHTGRVPPWLASRMASLGTIITQAIVLHYGRDAFLQRLSHPFWFQSFGAVMGMDWHSSGITTSVIGALKRGLAPLQDELGIYVCGGRGQHSRKTPDELMALGDRVGFDGVGLTRASRLVAKVDSAAVQDGFDLYLHGFFVTADGKWTVVQQGMNGDKRQARRYHWHSEPLKSFVDTPHSAIDGPVQGEIVNLTDHRADVSRAAQLELLTDLGPDRILAEFERLNGTEPAQALLPHLIMPAHHDVRPKDVFARRLHGTLAAASERGPVDFPELLLTPGVGARTVRSLAMVAEVVHGAPYRFADPARFSLAHGGKDRHPYPVPLKVYDETIRVLKGAIQNAKLGREEEMQAIKRLDVQARRLERSARGPSVEAYIAGERAASPELDGRSVFGWERDLIASRKSSA